jgi:hypothetical protein
VAAADKEMQRQRKKAATGSQDDDDDDDVEATDVLGTQEDEDVIF